MSILCRRCDRRSTSISNCALALAIIALLLLQYASYTVLAADAGGDDAYQEDDGAVAADDDDDGYYQDDGNGQDYEENWGYDEDGDQMNYRGDDTILYWTDYAIQPKRCVTLNDVDVLIFSLFENGAQHCTDDPTGVYYTPVPRYLQGFMNQKEQDMTDQGYDDYVAPEASDYILCTPQYIQDKLYYFQIGCADDTSEGLAVNVYADNTCTTRSYNDEGYDDANIDASDLRITFKKCSACVNWFDMNDDVEVDDGFYENRKSNAPLCSAAWAYKQDCDRKCQRAGSERSIRWESSDFMLLGILSAFGMLMVGLIHRMRQKMSSKDVLTEQATMNSNGMTQKHLIGLGVLLLLVIIVMSVLGFKNVTWGILLVVNVVLFSYLMKLTISSSQAVGESVIGPNGEILCKDSDDSSVEDDDDNPSNNADTKRGTYSLPTLS